MSTSNSKDGVPSWLPKSFWFIGICGFVTGGFVALGDRGDDLAATRSQVRVQNERADAGRDGRWRDQLPVAAPVTGIKSRDLGTKDAVGADAERGPTTNKTAIVLLRLGILGAAALYFGKKRGAMFGDGSTRSLQIVETVRIAGRYQLALVRAPAAALDRVDSL